MFRVLLLLSETLVRTATLVFFFLLGDRQLDKLSKKKVKSLFAVVTQSKIMIRSLEGLHCTAVTLIVNATDEGMLMVPYRCQWWTFTLVHPPFLGKK